MYEYIIYISITFIYSKLLIQILKLTATFNINNNKNAGKILNIFILPYLIPALFSLVLISINNFIPLFQLKDSNEFSLFFKIFKFGVVLTFIVAIYILISGGEWHYSNKSGGRDNRYKYNPYYPYYDDTTKEVCKQFLYLPIIFIIFLIIAFIIMIFLSKK